MKNGRIASWQAGSRSRENVLNMIEELYGLSFVWEDRWKQIIKIVWTASVSIDGLSLSGRMEERVPAWQGGS